MAKSAARPSGVLHEACLLPAMRRGTVVFCPYADVALVMDEFEGRLTVVMADGSVLHCPGPLSAVAVPGLIPLAPGVLAAPRLGRPRGSAIVYPAGWTFPKVKLSSTRPSFEPRSVKIQVGTSNEVDVTRLRSLSEHARGGEVTLDDGTVLVIGHGTVERVATQLGLPSANHLEPMSERHREMYRLGLRDFPYVLLQAPTPELKRVFGADAHLCIANLIWEAALHRWRGSPLDYGTEYRGFYYRPILPVLNRLGVKLAMQDVEPLQWPMDALLDLLDEGALDVLAGYNDPQFALYGRIISDMVGEARLITLHDLGFVETRPELRTLGTDNADWLIVAEKASIEPETRRLAADFRASSVILGGMARWEAAEPTADMLRPVLEGRRVKIVTYGDYDPAGWVIDDAFVTMLARYGIEADIKGRLVLPQRFTAEEIELVAEPIPMTGSSAGISRSWMERTHGVHGEAVGIHADHLRPYERVRQAFIEETGLKPLA